MSKTYVGAKHIFTTLESSNESVITLKAGIGETLVLEGNVTGNVAANPAGSDQQVQFNDAGDFGGATDLLYDKTAGTLTVPDVIVPTSHKITITDAPVNGTDAVNKTYADGLIGGTDTQVQYNDSGDLAGSSLFTFDKVDTLTVPNLDCPTGYMMTVADAPVNPIDVVNKDYVDNHGGGSSGNEIIKTNAIKTNTALNDFTGILTATIDDAWEGTVCDWYDKLAITNNFIDEKVNFYYDDGTLNWPLTASYTFNVCAYQDPLRIVVKDGFFLVMNLGESAIWIHDGGNPGSWSPCGITGGSFLIGGQICDATKNFSNVVITDINSSSYRMLVQTAGSPPTYPNNPPTVSVGKAIVDITINDTRVYCSHTVDQSVSVLDFSGNIVDVIRPMNKRSFSNFGKFVHANNNYLVVCNDTIVYVYRVSDNICIGAFEIPATILGIKIDYDDSSDYQTILVALSNDLKHIYLSPQQGLFVYSPINQWNVPTSITKKNISVYNTRQLLGQPDHFWNNYGEGGMYYFTFQYSNSSAFTSGYVYIGDTGIEIDSDYPVRITNNNVIAEEESATLIVEGSAYAKTMQTDNLTAGKTFILPKYTTTERDAISNPVSGMVIYNVTSNLLNFYNGSAWGAV